MKLHIRTPEGFEFEWIGTAKPMEGSNPPTVALCTPSGQAVLVCPVSHIVKDSPDE